MTKMGEIKVLGTAASPYANRVRFVLGLKSMDYEFVEEDLANKSDVLLTSNPIYKKVPVLFYGDEPPMCESLVIMEYLDEVRPDVHPILPSDPLERAQCRFLAYFIDDMFSPMMKELLLTQDDSRKETLKAHIIEGSQMLEQIFAKLSKGKDFFGGDDMGYLDIVLGCFLGWTKFSGRIFGFDVIDEVKTPGLARWTKSMWSHKVVKSVIPKDEVLVDFFTMLLTHKSAVAV